MSRIWIFGLVLVTVIAALKTLIVVELTYAQATPGMGILSGLFALFFALTAIVAYVACTQLNRHVVQRRREKLAPGVSEPIAKETVILRHASDWGLSQAEADVAIFVAKGFSNSEIAEMRGSAITTVKSQLGRIYQKSGLDTRYQLIAFVTDEVVSMAKEADRPDAKVETKVVLPLTGRRKQTAA
ncbi:Bacterial regulatory protein, LuxR family (plasmid) [Roseovarius sp. THAF9]|uniref:helix-turn-helix transcriptional regulator n=1 Tax=Roseovarius sp. THAF9 TaxID=2587847 RepID=UPI0012680CD3|nr:helix-turn-helix transcriptional regulator [Roseovarius sp. THAF9]QFT95198.1 Bacterial regulatory protein, LuxR family [Roseovarius sp. THAF9]